MWDGGLGIASGVEPPESLVRGPPGGVEVVDNVDDVVLDALEASDGLLELPAGLAVGERHLEDAVEAADPVGAEDGGRAEHGAVECVVGRRAGRDDGFGVERDVVEPELAESGGHAVDGSRGDTRCARGNDDEAGAVGVHAGRDEEVGGAGVEDAEADAVEAAIVGQEVSAVGNSIRRRRQ